MMLDKLPKRKQHHLRQYDYSAAGLYFVTICIVKHRMLLGTINEGRWKPSRLGKLVEHCWQDIPNHWPGVELDYFVVMPNHFHGLISISTRDSNASLPKVVQSFKAAVTRLANKQANTAGRKLWQENYYDHVVRDDDDLARIRKYIIENPLAWHLDRENPARIALNPFYAYIDTMKELPRCS